MGFFAVLAASLFAVFLYRVRRLFASALVSAVLWMVVPPAVVLAVLVWTFPKNGRQDHRPAKAGGEAGSRTQKTPKSPRNNTATPLQKKLSCRGVALLHLTFYPVGHPTFEHHHAQNCKAGTQHKTHCPQRHAEQKNTHGNAEQDTRDLTFLHFTVLPFRTMQRTAATKAHTAPELPPQYPEAPATRCSVEEGFSRDRPRSRHGKAHQG